MITLLACIGYFVMAIVTGRVTYLSVEWYREMIDDGFWDYPWPLFSVVFWPITLLCAICAILAHPIILLITNGPMHYIRGGKPKMTKHQRRVEKKKLAIVQTRELAALEQELAAEHAKAEQDWDKKFEILDKEMR